MTPHERVTAHKASGVIYSWRWDVYSGCEVLIVAVVDRTGRGRFERIEAYGQTLNMALDDLADQCDALPGAGRKGKAAA